MFWGCWAFGPITLAAREVGCQFLVLQISKKSKDPLKRERGETGDFERLCTQLISSTTKFLPVVRGHPFSELFTMNNQSLMAKLKKKKNNSFNRRVPSEYSTQATSTYTTQLKVCFITKQRERAVFIPKETRNIFLLYPSRIPSALSYKAA